MASSYLLLDEYLCFLDKGAGVEKQSSSILEVGVQKSLSEVYWDQKAFEQRGGIFEWTKDDLGNEDTEGENSCGAANTKSLDWRATRLLMWTINATWEAMMRVELSEHVRLSGPAK